MEQQKVLELIKAERSRQDAKWGKNSHHPVDWYLIASEEMGEVAKALLSNDPISLRKEVVQTAAVLIAWLEDTPQEATDASDE